MRQVRGTELLLVVALLGGALAALVPMAGAAAPALLWQNALGGSGADHATDTQPTADGGFIVVGTTTSTDGDVTGNHGGVDLWDNPCSDVWVVKLNAAGALVWQRCLGGSGYDGARGVQQTTDGGYIVAGWTYSDDGDVSGQHQNHTEVFEGYWSSDAWLVKLDATGSVVWQKCLGGTGFDYASGVQQTADGGYVVAGHTRSNDGDVAGLHGGNSWWGTSVNEWEGHQDVWVVKVSAAGDLEWQKCLGGTWDEQASAVQQTADGGYIVSGWTASPDGDVAGYHGTYSDSYAPVDAWVVKLNAAGGIVWQRCLGGTGEDGASAVRQTADGGYIVVGRTASTNGDVSGLHGDFDAWVLKLTAAGTPVWKRCLGGTGSDGLSSVQQLADGGFLVAGYAHSSGGDVAGNHGGGDLWVLRLDGWGGTVWQKCLGGSAGDYADLILPDGAGNYIVAGETYSSGGDVAGYHGGGADAWVVKLDPDWNDMVRYEAEDFDSTRRPGEAYFDTTPGNSGGAYRTTDVDIRTYGTDGYEVTDIRDGEWTRYTVDNQKSSGYAYLTSCKYPLALRVNADRPGRSISVQVNGVTTATLDVPATRVYSWVNTTVELPPGISTLTFVHHESELLATAELDFDYFGLDFGGAVIAFPYVPSALTLVPMDLDLDGTYEDTNGNGRKDFADIVLYFNQLSWIPENQPVPAFDYNANGRVDFADVVWLFNHL